MSDDNSESGRKKLAVAGPSGSTVPVAAVKTEQEMNKPIGRVYTDAVLNFLLRLACQVSEILSCTLVLLNIQM